MASTPCFAQRGDRGGHNSGGGSGEHWNSGGNQGNKQGSGNQGSSSFKSNDSRGSSNSNHSGPSGPFLGNPDSDNQGASQSNPQEHQSFFRGSSDNVSDGRRNSDRNNDSNRNNSNNAINKIFNDRAATNWNNKDRSDWSRAASNVRDDWNRRKGDDLPFRGNWWNGYSRDRWPGYSPWLSSRWSDRPWYWWSWTPSARLVPWFVFGWNSPRYWDYGPGANIYYQDDYVYYDGQQYLPVDDYYQRMYRLAHSVPNIDTATADKMEWAPLGVFAVLRDGSNQSQQRTLQLAVNRDGVLTGTYFNNEKNQAHPITGMVDNRTQRAAFAFADGELPQAVFETSVFNLTKPESTMMVHFGPQSSETEVWHLARLERPEAASGGQNLPVPRQSNELP